MAYGAASGATASADLDAAEDAARTAAIRDAVLARADAYEVASSARAISHAAGDLLSEDERMRLLAPIEALDAHLGTALPPHRDAADVTGYSQRFLPLLDAVNVALRVARDAAVDTANDRLNAATLASLESREAVTDAIAALEDANPTAELVAELFTAVEAAEKSDQAAAAAAAGTPVGGDNGGAGSSEGSGGSGGTGGTGGTPPAPGGPTTPPPPPPYTDADARAAVMAAHADAQQGGGAGCYEINSGAWGRSSVPPPPARSMIADGGWLGFTAWSTGTGGAVKYFACY
jgi:hypothetical protein